MSEDRTKLLHSLSIERAETKAPPAGRGLWWKLGAGIAATMIVAVAVWLLAPALSVGGRSDQVAAQEAQPAPAPKPPAPMAVTDPRPPGGLAASGYIVARRKATVAAEITGKVVEVLVEEGMMVDRGQLVAHIDSVLAEKDLALAQSKSTAAEAAVAAVAADLRDAERILTRVHNLSQKSFASEADFTKAEARVGVLRAQLSQSQAQLETARLDAQRSAEVVEKHRIRAPFSGVVVERSAQPGEMISPMSAGGSFTRTGICTIVDMGSIEIEVDVNEAFIGRVHQNGAVAAVLDAYPNWTIPAAVIAVVPTANREKATVKVRIGLQQKDPRILPDMAVKVTFLDDVAPASAATAVQSPTAN
jgi:RND family efflux transporter MFP subunit